VLLLIYLYIFFKGFDLHKLESGPSLNVECTKNEALDYYHKMQSVRRLETTAGNLYKEKQIRGFCHLYSGQVTYFFLLSNNNNINKDFKIRKQFVLE